jgi:hypothetical protein
LPLSACFDLTFGLLTPLPRETAAIPRVPAGPPARNAEWQRADRQRWDSHPDTHEFTNELNRLGARINEIDRKLMEP